MLSNYLSRIALEYAYERAKPFIGSDFSHFVRQETVVEAKKLIGLWPFDLKVKASVGQGAWASVPWLAFFDPIITEKATSGFYVVFLINPDQQTIVLSMNQGATEIFQEHGITRGREVLRRRARDMADRVPDFAKHFSESPIHLGSNADLPLGYEAGHSFGKMYQADHFELGQLSNDLRRMLDAYSTLIERGGTTPAEIMHEESGSTDAEETRRYVLSRRIERSPKVRKEVLKIRPAICECCGLDPKRDYGFNQPAHLMPLDVHHSVPLFGLAEGQSRRYKVPEDFMVLCPTCHRMIHKIGEPWNLEKLKSMVRFKIARDITFGNF